MPPNPEFIFGTFNAYQRSAALRGAIELDLFTAIGAGAATAEALAERCQASLRGVRILCDFLVVIGLLAKDGSRYSLTPETALFLDRRSPAYLGSAVTFLHSPVLTDGFRDVAAVVRKGGTLLGKAGTMEPDHPIWVEFARAMAPMMGPASEAIAGLVGAGPWKVLDIAAGHGLFGLAVAKRHPQTEVAAVDWPNVLALAEENARAAGAGARFRKLAGSAFQVDYGSGYDLALVANFFHHFDEAACVALARRIHQALQPGGRLVTLEFIPNQDRVSPPQPAAFALMMLGTTEAGDSYTFPEYDRIFRAAGFGASELHELAVSPERVIITAR